MRGLVLIKLFLKGDIVMIRDFGALGAYAETSGKHPIPGIDCRVENCYYNKNGTACTAGEIRVGPTNASTTYDTACATFRPLNSVF